MNQLPPTAPIRAVTEKRQEYIIKTQTATVDSYAWDCCVNCEHWDDAKQGCKLYLDEKGEPIKPPAKVITVGCVSYTSNIPF